MRQKLRKTFGEMFYVHNLNEEGKKQIVYEIIIHDSSTRINEWRCSDLEIMLKLRFQQKKLITLQNTNASSIDRNFH